MTAFEIDARQVPFNNGDNILKAALNAGVEIPHFCYHHALGSLGACRLCAVEVKPEQPEQRPRVVMACMEPARAGLKVSVAAPAALRARQGVIEFLMTNHPHDCPVCDEGGECHLQDMTVACGPPYRRYRGRKRTFINQDLGPLVHHEMNRCITCYRCTRYYQQYALGTDLGAMRLRNEVYFGRFQDGPLESPFAGNLVEVCPTGVFTDKVFRSRFARVWDLDTAPSICPHCSVGCNTLPGARLGTLRRVRNRDHAELNRWFLCDRGRFGHQYTEHPERPWQARVRGQTVNYSDALGAALDQLQRAGAAVAGVGSPREDLESNALLQRLIIRHGGFFAAFTDPGIEAATAHAVRYINRMGTPTLAAMEHADAILVAGELTAVAPMMDLGVRQASRNKAKVGVIHHVADPLATLADYDIRLAPRQTSVALKRLQGMIATTAEQSSGDEHGLAQLAATLMHAQHPLLIGVVETLGAYGVAALAKLAQSLGGQAALAYALPGPNAYGAAIVNEDGATQKVLEAVETGKVRCLVVTAADPLGDTRTGWRWREAVGRLDSLIVMDCVDSATVRAADILIPTAAWAERSGYFINYEGRVQCFDRVFERDKPLPASVAVIADLANALDLGAGEPRVAIADLLPGIALPLAGEPGIRLTPRVRLDVPPPIESVAGATGHWQVGLASWYGDDPLADHAAALSSLAPASTATIAPDTARIAELATDARVMLRGPAGSLPLPLCIDANVAEDTVALPRSAMCQIGVGHGGYVELEAMP